MGSWYQMLSGLLVRDEITRDGLHRRTNARGALREITVGVENFEIGQLLAQTRGLGLGDRNLWPQLGDSAH